MKMKKPCFPLFVTVLSWVLLSGYTMRSEKLIHAAMLPLPCPD